MWCKPRTMQRIQGWLVLVWIALTVPGVTIWKESVPFLVFISLYTIVMEHVNAWLTARAEAKKNQSRS